MASSKAKLLASMDPFTKAYCQTALWSTIDQDNSKTHQESLDKNYKVEDISVKTLREMIKDCRAFQKDNQQLLEDSGMSYARAGQDFWLTRERHGAGFWDEGIGELGRKLTDAAHAYGGYDLYSFEGEVHSN